MFGRGKTVLILFTFIVASILAAALIWQAQIAAPRRPASFPPGDYSYVISLAEHRIQQIMDRHHVPGMSAALVHDQQIIWQKSFGMADISREQPVTNDTVFKLLSLAKPFTAVEIMRLVELGELDLDGPIEGYLPGFELKSRYPVVEPITVRHLLTHHAGLPRNDCVSSHEWYMGDAALQQLSESVAHCYLAYPPGDRYKYSNVGYVALGYIIQDMRGEPFPAYMQTQLLRPMGMTSAAFWSSELPQGSELATGYEYYNSEQSALTQVDVTSIPSGNLYGSVGDLTAFVRFLFRGGVAAGGSGDSLIQEQTLAQMYVDQFSRPADPQKIGLGWKIGPTLGGERMIWHDGGASEGVGSLVAMLPEAKLGVILLGNATSFAGGVSAPLAVELLEVMQETETGMAQTRPESRASVAADESVPARYAGSYILFDEVVEVKHEGGRLNGSMQGLSFAFEPLGAGRFALSHWLLTLGLADLLALPVNLNDVIISFHTAEEPAHDYMTVNFGDISNELAPRYPSATDVPAAWQALSGEYARFGRLPSGEAGPEQLGQMFIELDDGRLHMSGGVGPILPMNDHTIIVLGSAFAGETIQIEPATGFLYHQGFVYKPVAAR